MINLLFSLILAVNAAPIEKLPRAGISLIIPQGSWKKMQSLPVLDLQDFDLLLENAKNPSNHRFVVTQFGKTSDICQGEVNSLQKAGFKVYTEKKALWACILRAENGSDRRLLAVREIKRSAGKKRPVFVSQVMLVETRADSFVDYEKWISSVKAIR